MSTTKRQPDGTHAGPASGGRPWTLVYDGTCNVCSRLVRRVARWDSRHVIQMVASQNDTVSTRFPWISAEQFRESMYLVAADGRMWSGAAATRQLLRILPFGFLLGWLWGLPTFGALADSGYRIFAR
ncbi:MAG: thiol-disulfide oxidoreductase DCC family protein, partial [Gemmatimonadales bacterium]